MINLTRVKSRKKAIYFFKLAFVFISYKSMFYKSILSNPSLQIFILQIQSSPVQSLFYNMTSTTLLVVTASCRLILPKDSLAEIPKLASMNFKTRQPGACRQQKFQNSLAEIPKLASEKLNSHLGSKNWHSTIKTRHSTERTRPTLGP